MQSFTPVNSNMPPKKDSSSNANFLGQNEEDKILQAVVIADSFNERFMPITIDKPRVRRSSQNNLVINHSLVPVATR
jgi:translation initiation factor eIF-2B subunit epsilon